MLSILLGFVLIKIDSGGTAARDNHAMTSKARSIAMTFAVAATALAGTGVVAPLAHANGADSVIRDLEAEGYTVRINWLNGARTSLLPRCSVLRVNNPSSSEPAPGDVVWVDVRCPNNVS
jgi:hypothetical protein